MSTSTIPNIYENYYSQYGEDQVVYNILKDTSHGVYIDVGAHDGIRFSNTYFYELLGWEGICVEAHPDYYKICKDNRPNSNVLHCACSDTDGTCDIYANYRGALTTINPNLNNFFSEHYKGYYGEGKDGLIQGMINGKITVPAKKLDTIIKEEIGENKQIDLLSIDTDGSEKWVFSGFDITKWNPRVVIVEVSVVPKIVYKYFEDTKYIKAYSNGTNTIYCRDECDAKLIKKYIVTGNQIKVKHCLD